MMIHRKLASKHFLAIFMLALSICSCTEEPPSLARIRIVDTHFMGLLPLYIAEEKGYFREQGLAIEWVDVRDPGQASRAFFAGQADVLMSTFANLLPAEAQQPATLRLLLPAYESSDEPGSYVLVRPDSPLRNLVDLRGKTLATYSGPSQKAYALVFLRKLGFLNPPAINLVQVGTSAQVQSLLSGSIDALFTVEPYGSVAIASGARVLEEGIRTKYISNPFWVGSAAVHAKFLASNRQAIGGLLKALADATTFIEQGNPEVRGILARHTNMSPAVAARCRLYHWVTNPSNDQVAQIQSHAQLLAEEGLLTSPIEVEPLLLKP